MNEDELIILIILKLRGMVGRYYLASVTGLSEGRLRGILRRLKDSRMISVSKSGSTITEEGIHIVNDFLNSIGISKIIDVDLSRVFAEKMNYCLAAGLTGALLSDRDIVHIRDAAIKAGCEAALIMKVECSSVAIPLTGLTLEHYDPELAGIVKREYGCGTYVLSACGSTLYNVVRGVLNMAKAAKRT